MQNARPPGQLGTLVQTRGDVLIQPSSSLRCWALGLRSLCTSRCVVSSRRSCYNNGNTLFRRFVVRLLLRSTFEYVLIMPPPYRSLSPCLGTGIEVQVYYFHVRHVRVFLIRPKQDRTGCRLKLWYLDSFCTTMYYARNTPQYCILLSIVNFERLLGNVRSPPGNLNQSAGNCRHLEMEMETRTWSWGFENAEYMRNQKMSCNESPL